MNSLFRRLAAAAAAALVLLGGCAEAGLPGGLSALPPPSSPSAVEKAPADSFIIPWFDGDTLNPYSCKTVQNYYLAGLLCDPLVALDNQTIPQNRLALEISENQGAYTIVLRHDVAFADGSPLTAQDVLYSLGLAQASPRFAAGLAGVDTATATENGSVLITLKAPDVFFPRSLSFPIVKEGTGEEAVPVGIGRFVASLGQQKLTRSPSYYNPVKTIREIVLLPTDSLEAQTFAIMEGRVDFMYSDLQSDLNLGMGMGYRQVPLSNMLYLAVNGKGPGGELPVRQALSGLIDRNELVRKVYQGFATATDLPISPVAATLNHSASELEVNRPKQEALLEQAGWSPGADGLRYRAGLPLRFELLVNSESSARKAMADLIAQSCKSAGITLTVVSLPFAQYSQRIAKGEYDLYIGEVRPAYNKDISGLILPGGALNPGAPDIPALASLLPQVRSGKAEAKALEEELINSLPILPLLFRKGIICFSRDFSANIVATEQDIFYNIVDW